MGTKGGIAMSSVSGSFDGNTWPAWLEAVRANLAARPQMVLYGNIRDIYNIRPDGSTGVARDIIGALWHMLEAEDYQGMIVYDGLKGLSTFPPTQEWTNAVCAALGVAEDSFRHPTLDRVIDWMDWATAGCAPSREPRLRLAFVVNYASRIARSPDQLEQAQHDLFHAAEKLANDTAIDRRQRHGPARLGGELTRYYNPVIWIANRERDLPIWFVGDNPRITSQVVPTPLAQERDAFARPMFSSAGPNREKIIERVVDLTEGEPLLALTAVQAIAQGSGFALESEEDVTRAVRLYKLGVSQNYWDQGRVRDKLTRAEETLSASLMGQDRPIRDALDRLKRSALGLSGAHGSRTSRRPRTVMMLAGPTGVGKTELVRAISRLLFSTEDCVRFDMSEFSQEHTDQRLLGAPPGYVGYDAGGELTNAVRARPFSVLLFDEIEKAHPRILDKFLQILEDGRLTDSHGVTTYFSESMIFFTTNKGVYKEIPLVDDRGVPMLDERTGRPRYRRELVEYASESDMVGKVVDALERFFRDDLGRPEIMNRIGPDNVIVFNPITQTVGLRILDLMLKRVMDQLERLHGTTVALSDVARKQLADLCLADLAEYGGRGIGNRLETVLVNPLARDLFDRPRRRVQIQSINTSGPEVVLEFEHG